MHFRKLGRGIKIAPLLLLLVSIAQAAHYTPAVESLGRVLLVLDDESTQLNELNLGNPAGLVWLPVQNRADFLLGYAQQVKIEEFVTGPEGSLSAIDPQGNTLLPNTLYTYKTSTHTLDLDDWENLGLGGVITWLNPQAVLQIVPQGEKTNTSATFPLGNQSAGWGGGRVRGAWRLNNAFAVGLGVHTEASQANGGQPAEITDPFTTTLPAVAASESVSQGAKLGAEAGFVWRLEEVFDQEDHLDLGLKLNGSKLSQHTRYAYAAGTLPDLGINPEGTCQNTQYPWEAQWQSVYAYKNLLDISFLLGYEGYQIIRYWQSDYFNQQAEYLSDRLDNFTYEIGFRVRLPMIRDDDLRFGVVFNNQPAYHPYPTGHLQITDPTRSFIPPAIDTASSSIGIGMSIVPGEGSVVALEYHLGSSKTRQGDKLLADSGYVNFSVGAQYQLWEGLFLRLGFLEEQVAYETHPDSSDTGSSRVITRETETSSFCLGLGIQEGSLRVDLSLISAYTGHSPRGWTFLEKPTAIQEVNNDTTQTLSGLLGVTWLY